MLRPPPGPQLLVPRYVGAALGCAAGSRAPLPGGRRLEISGFPSAELATPEVEPLFVSHLFR